MEIEYPIKNGVNFKYFKFSEFDSPDAPGSGSFMKLPFILKLDKIRARCGFPLKVSSGYRTASHNAIVGGAINSAHTQGIAADLVIPEPCGRNRMIFIKAAIEEGIDRIGIGKTFVHVDASEALPRNVMWTY